MSRKRATTAAVHQPRNSSPFSAVDSLGAPQTPPPASSSDQNEPDPVVIARVRLQGDEIPKAMEIPPELLLAGVEVHARVRCGNHAMGYSLFYGVWEFIYEKVVFFF